MSTSIYYEHTHSHLLKVRDFPQHNHSADSATHRGKRGGTSHSCGALSDGGTAFGADVWIWKVKACWVGTDQICGYDYDECI